MRYNLQTPLISLKIYLNNIINDLPVVIVTAASHIPFHIGSKSYPTPLPKFSFNGLSKFLKAAPKSQQLPAKAINKDS
jgi:hypothetical protein